jgi:hypothetical protein
MTGDQKNGKSKSGQKAMVENIRKQSKVTKSVLKTLRSKERL